MNDSAKPPLTTTTSILPATLVLAVAVVTLLVFLALNFITNPHVVTNVNTTPIVVGSLATEAGPAVLGGCQQAGNPPLDIGAALLVPVSTRATGPATHPNGGAGDYDCLRALATPVSPAQLLGYYSAQLAARGWHLFSRGSSSGGAQLLFQKAGSDTFYWIVGITVRRQVGPETYWTYRIYQNSSAI